jgi:cell division protein FtsQ
MNQRLKKILRNIVFLLSIPLLISAFVFAQKSTDKDVCKGLDIDIVHTDLSFVTENDIIDIVEKAGVRPDASFINGIHLTEVEKALQDNKWIKSANAYIGSDQILYVTVDQKRPVIRIVENDNSDYAYYLDAQSNPIELSAQYSPSLPVVTTPSLSYSQKDNQLKSDLVSLSQFIQEDSFWNAAIAQINVRTDGMIDLIPSIGHQVILIGTIEGLENKMSRLLTFYQQGMQTVNWDVYDEIDLRFAGQVVCRNYEGEVLTQNPYDKPLPAKAKPVAPTTATPVVAQNNLQPKTVNAKPAPKVIVKKTTNDVNKTSTPKKAIQANQAAKPKPKDKVKEQPKVEKTNPTKPITN